MLVPPGTYTVTLTAGGQKFTEKFQVIKDPHSSGTAGDIQTQAQFQRSLWEEMNSLAGAINQIESLRAQIAAFQKELGKEESVKPVRKAADELAEKLAGVEGNLLQLKLTGRGQDDCRWAPMLLQKINYLFAQVDGTADFPPTTQQTAVAELLKAEGGKAKQDLKQLIDKDLAAFNAILRERNISNIRTPTLGKEQHD